LARGPGTGGDVHDRDRGGERVAKYHDRMPVIVDAADFVLWFAPATPTDKIMTLIESRPVAGMDVVAVNPTVNNPRNQSRTA
jgi:putative SOS response-associated peptidase YedK